MKPTHTLLALLVTYAAAAEPLVVVDEEGARHGPFELRTAAALPLRGHVYKVERLPDEAQALVDALKTTLPAFQFIDARLPELVRFVREKAVPQNVEVDAKAVRLVHPRVPDGPLQRRACNVFPHSSNA